MPQTRTGPYLALALAAVLAVLVVAAGPAFDHHFAERQASHGHVFLAPSSFEHEHAVGDEHGHAPGDRATAGVVATPDDDAAGAQADTLAPPPQHHAGGETIAVRFVGTTGDETAPPGVVAPPPLRPPVA